MISLAQRDSYLKESTDTVLESSALSDGKFQIILADSVLYPEGGGQPSDFGTVGGHDVLDVSTSPNGIKVILSSPLEVGCKVISRVDWLRRFDFMQHHTGQHLISAVANKLFCADTVHWELGAEFASVDFKTEVSFSQEHLATLEASINEEIRLSRAVSCSSFMANDFDAIPFKRGIAKGAAAELEVLRVVMIDGLDSNPCGGTHVRNTCELQMIKLLGMEKDRGSTRVKFIVGDRILRTLGACLRRESQLTMLLTMPPKDHVETVEKVMKERRIAAKERKQIVEELARSFAISLAFSGSSQSNIRTGRKFIVRHCMGADLVFLQNVSDIMQTELVPECMIFLSGDNSSAVPILNPVKSVPPSNKKKDKNNSPVVSTAISTTSATEGYFICVGNAKNISDMKNDMLSRIGGRGGGKPGKLQGTFDPSKLALVPSQDSIEVLKSSITIIEQTVLEIFLAHLLPSCSETSAEIKTTSDGIH